jgi:hypothetical protein
MYDFKSVCMHTDVFNRALSNSCEISVCVRVCAEWRGNVTKSQVLLIITVSC